MKRSAWSIAVTAALLILGLPLFQVIAQTPDPLVGTWEMNVAKSTFKPGPAPKSATRKFEAVENGLKYSGQGVNADGTTWAAQFTAYFDGKDYPVIGDANGDTLSLKRIDRFTTEGTYKKAGKVTYRATRVVSKDGKVLTITTEGTNAKGEPTANVLVHDKR